MGNIRFPAWVKALPVVGFLAIAIEWLHFSYGPTHALLQLLSHPRF